MSVSKIVLWGCLLVSSAGLCRADVGQLKATFQSFVEALDSDAPRRDPPDPGPMFDAVRAATADDIRALLPLAEDLLHSPKIKVRGAALLLMLSVSMRPADSSKLLEPYIDDVALALNDSDQGVRNGAIAILGGTHPSPLPKALTYLEAHLNDKTNDDGAAQGIAGALLESGDRSAVSKVLALVQQRPVLQGGVIQMLGRFKITTEDALGFVHAGLRDSKVGIRRTAVDAVGNLPKEVRKGFEQDLLRLMANPDEDPQVRERAQAVLIQ
jgi:HEAT repeat protein